MKTQILFTLTLAGILWIGAGCATSTPTQTYILPNTLSCTASSITVRDVDIPEYLDQKNLVVRVSKYEVKSLPYQQWGQNFRQMLTQSLQNEFNKQAPQKSTPIFLELTFANFELNTETQSLETSLICKTLATNTPQNLACAFSIPLPTKEYQQLPALYEQAIHRIVVELLAQLKK